MASLFPNALDTDTQFPKTGIVAGVTTGEVTHTMNVYGAVQALEAKVGVGASTPASANGRYLASKTDGTTFWEPPRTYLITITSTSYTLLAANEGYAHEFDSVSNGTWTVPTGLPDGAVYELVPVNTGTLTLVAGAGMTLLTASTLQARARYSTIAVRIRSSTSAIVAGDLA